MDIVVSTSAYLAFNIVDMDKLPRDLGVEALIENANDNVWYQAFKILLKDRPSSFTIHGPFLYMNLAAKDCEFDRVIENYKWTFEYSNRYNAKHVVLHPQGYMLGPDNETAESCRARCLDRINTLGDLAVANNANLLVENLCYPWLVFEQEEYVDLFRQIPTVHSLIDVGHSLIKEWDVPKLLKDLGPRIDAYHIDDNMGPGTPDSHFKLGQGVLDYREFFTAYNKYTPDKRLVIEYLNVSTNEIVESANWIKQLVQECK